MLFAARGSSTRERTRRGDRCPHRGRGHRRPRRAPDDAAASSATDWCLRPGSSTSTRICGSPDTRTRRRSRPDQGGRNRRVHRGLFDGQHGPGNRSAAVVDEIADKKAAAAGLWTSSRSGRLRWVSRASSSRRSARWSPRASGCSATTATACRTRGSCATRSPTRRRSRRRS